MRGSKRRLHANMARLSQDTEDNKQYNRISIEVKNVKISANTWAAPNQRVLINAPRTNKKANSTVHLIKKEKYIKQ